MIPDDETDGPLSLPADTQAILDGFLRNKREAAADKDPFAEDWGLSQFWYTKETASKVAAEAARAAKGGRIACLACPSLFRALQEQHPDAAATVFEFDRRFEASLCFDLLALHRWSAIQRTVCAGPRQLLLL